MNVFEISNDNILNIKIENGSDIALMSFFVPLTVHFILKSMTRKEDNNSISYTYDNFNYINSAVLNKDEKLYDWKFIEMNELKWMRITKDIDFVTLKSINTNHIFNNRNKFTFIIKNDKEKHLIISRDLQTIYTTIKTRIRHTMSILDKEICTSYGNFPDCPINFRTTTRMRTCLMWRRESIEGDICNKKLSTYERDVSIRNFCFQSNHTDCSCYNAYTMNFKKFVVTPLCWYKDCLFDNYLVESEYSGYRRNCIRDPNWFWYLSTIAQPNGEFNGFLTPAQEMVIYPY